jgi:hypothetical protein
MSTDGVAIDTLNITDTISITHTTSIESTNTNTNESTSTNTSTNTNESTNTNTKKDETVLVTQPVEMTEKKIKRTFESIVEFTNELYEYFGYTKKNGKPSPLSLYHRLMGHVKFADTVTMKKFIDGFTNFFNEHSKCIIDGKHDELPRGTIIKYNNSNTICLEIQLYIHKSNDEMKKCIGSHLIAICNHTNPSEKVHDKVAQMMKENGGAAPNLNIDTGTNEGKFLSNILADTSKLLPVMKDIDSPMAAVGAIMQSGLMQNLWNNLENGVKNNELDPKKLQGMVGEVIGPLFSQLK